MYQIGQWLLQNQWKSKLNWLEIFKLKKNLNRNIWTTYYCLFILFSNTCCWRLNWFSVNSSSVKNYFLLPLWVLKRTQNIKISLLIKSGIVAFQGYSRGRTFAATARAVSTGTSPASSGKLNYSKYPWLRIKV